MTSCWKQQGDLCFKTDNQRFLSGRLRRSVSTAGCSRIFRSTCTAPDFEGNVMTEYEEKFSSEGARIYRLEARRRLPEFLRK